MCFFALCSVEYGIQPMNGPFERELAAFAHARQLPDAERTVYLDQACAGDAALRRTVQELLRAGEAAEGFLEQPAPGVQRPEASSASVLDASLAAHAEKPGDRIGRYKLLQQIGEGGCGVVYMAEQEEPVRRHVALKVIKLGMDTKSVIARFEAERQALAMMDHPGIAKVLDAGATDTGRPYFVMELVRGTKITEFCDQKQLSMRERLGLFIEVCRAIQHAHQKGIIHRDIKPSNILVTLRDGVPVPKVIDFGIAKATTDQRLTDKTLFTEFAMFIGTPAYMSPEQAEMSELGIDTRSDIYSLGILLYELLTGTTPFDSRKLMKAGLMELRRIIREEAPARPSTRLTTMAAGDLTQVAGHRQAEPTKLSSLVRGDLDWIVMKALDKDRARRYETASALAMDVQQHLNCEPVIARPPSRLYEFQKTVRRHKFGFAAAAALITLLAAGALVSTFEAIRATQAERKQTQLLRRAEAGEKKASSEAVKSQQVATFLKDMLESAGPEVALGRDTTLLRGILDRTASRVREQLADQPAVQAELLSLSGRVYETIGEDALAEAACRQALAIQRKVLGKNEPALAETLVSLAMAIGGRTEAQQEVEACYREALEIRRQVYGYENWSVADCLNNLPVPLAKQGKFSEAESISRQTLDMKRKLIASELAAASVATNADLTLELKRRIHSHGDVEVAISIRDLGLVLRAAGRFGEAETAFREALATFRNTQGHDHQVAFTLNGLAIVLSDLGRLDEAEAADREALAIQKKLYDSNSSHVINTLGRLMDILKQEGKLVEAMALHEAQTNTAAKNNNELR